MTLLVTFLSFAAQASYCIAHRGYSGHYFENSLEAIKEAVWAGADGVEFDVVHTRDGVPIINHDHTLERVTLPSPDCPNFLSISNLKYSQIKNCRLLNGEPIPLLAEVLDFLTEYPDTFIFVDLKDAPTTEFFELFEPFEELEMVRFIAFEKDYLRSIHNRLTGSRTLLLSHFWPRGLRFGGANLNYRSRRALYVYKLFGLETGAWTINGPRQMESVLKIGVDFLTTDFVSRCLRMREQTGK